MKANVKVLVLLIAVITFISGVVQMIAPAMVLEFIGAEATEYTSHFFSIIGMFMALFGGLIIHSLYSVQENKAALFWSGLQKIGAALAVGIGVQKGIFAAIALSVAIFDALSGLIIFYYLYSLRKP